MDQEHNIEQIFVANAHPSLEVDPERIQTVAAEVLARENCVVGKVNVILATDTDLKNMNSQYLGRDRPTDVLAFAMGRDEHQAIQDQVVGEIYISLDRAQQQSLEYQVRFTREVERLVIHGLLHLCGYDHENDGDSHRMKTREEELLEQLR
jgi:probable rRNA maturation factor